MRAVRGSACKLAVLSPVVNPMRNRSEEEIHPTAHDNPLHGALFVAGFMADPTDTCQLRESNQKSRKIKIDSQIK